MPSLEQIADPMDTASDLPQRPSGRRRVDWNQAASLLAEGQSVEAVAAVLGCDAKVILRNLRRSPRFRRRIESAHERRRLAAQLRFAQMGELAVQSMRAGRLDAKMLQWLGDRLGLRHFGPRDEAGVAERWEAAVRPGSAPGKSQVPEQPSEIGEAELAAILQDAREWDEQCRARERAFREQLRAREQAAAEAEAEG